MSAARMTIVIDPILLCEESRFAMIQMSLGCLAEAEIRANYSLTG